MDSSEEMDHYFTLDQPKPESMDWSPMPMSEPEPEPEPMMDTSDEMIWNPSIASHRIDRIQVNAKFALVGWSIGSNGHDATQRKRTNFYRSIDRDYRDVLS